MPPPPHILENKHETSGVIFSLCKRRQLHSQHQSLIFIIPEARAKPSVRNWDHKKVPKSWPGYYFM